MTTFVDGAATFAPVQAPLRDWLRERMASDLGTDANGKVQVYATGGFPKAMDLSDGPAVALYTAGGTAGGTALDRPFVRFNVVATSAEVAEATAYTLRSVLEHAAGAALGTQADPSDVRLVGAQTESPIWSPDLDVPGTSRFVVTATLTVQAVGI